MVFCVRYTRSRPTHSHHLPRRHRRERGERAEEREGERYARDAGEDEGQGEHVQGDGCEIRFHDSPFVC